MNAFANERGSLLYSLVLVLIIPLVSITVLTLLMAQVVNDRNSAINHKAEYLAQGAMDALNDYLMIDADQAEFTLDDWIDNYGSINYSGVDGSTIQLEYSTYPAESYEHFGYQVTASVTSANQTVMKSVRYELRYWQPEDGGIYKLINVSNDMALTSDETDPNYTNAIIAPESDSDSQLWKVIHVEDIDNNNGYPTYKLISMASGKALDVQNAGTAAGTNVNVFEDNYTNAQKWQFSNRGNNEFFIRYPHGNKVLGISGTNAVINNYFIQDHLMWRLVLVELPDDSEFMDYANYKLYNPDTDKVLDVINNNQSDGAPVYVAGDNGTGAQRWIMTRNDDGTYRITLNAYLSLDVAMGHEPWNVGEGAIVQIANHNDSAAQKWTIVSNGDGTHQLVYRFGYPDAKLLSVDQYNRAVMYSEGHPNAVSQSWDIRKRSGSLPKEFVPNRIR